MRSDRHRKRLVARENLRDDRVQLIPSQLFYTKEFEYDKLMAA